MSYPSHRFCVAPMIAAARLAAVAFGAGWAAIAGAQATLVDTVEFYNATLDHYFITALRADIEALDSGKFVGWKRTGEIFSAYATAADGMTPVCRFYLPPQNGDSHFYSASPAECDEVKVKFPSLVYEAPAVMYVGLPDAVTGACAASFVPIYRLWNKRADSNHRYTSNREIRAAMLSKGYVSEGYGPEGVAMCSPLAGSPVLTAAQKRKDAARFLRQATFGASREAIDALVIQGYEAWIAEQFAKPAVLHVATVMADPNMRIAGKTGLTSMASAWKQYFEGEDQLRQRVGYALSQIFVVSRNNGGVEAGHCALAGYVDVLNRGAFGNFRALLKDITLNPAMGEYLSMKKSAKADPIAQTQPDENYAREVMQLFTVGLVMLNEDGSVKRGSEGNTMPTFNEDTVKGFARALSGWTHAGQDQSNGGNWMYPDLIRPDPESTVQTACPAWTRPMEPWMTQYLVTIDPPPRFVEGPAHDMDAKQLLAYAGARYATLPAGQSPQADLENVIDNLFYHPNVGPFIAKQLIQRLVMSNPSPGYVQRIARTFNDNGSGVRGDMKAVVRAILLDDEARNLAVATQPTFGKLTEPAIRFVAFHRAFKGRRASGYYDLRDFSTPDDLGQNPLTAPSVFNFYHPNYAPAGPLTQAGLVGPEFEITNASTIAGFAEFAGVNFILGFDNYYADSGRRIMPDYSEYLPLADTPGELIDALELVLCAGCLNPAFKAQLIDAIGKVNWGSTQVSPAERTEYLRQEKLYAALWQIINSPDYSVQK